MTFHDSWHSHPTGVMPSLVPNSLKVMICCMWCAFHEEDWSLEYLHGKEFEVDHLLSAIGFTTLPEKDNARDWVMYH